MGTCGCRWCPVNLQKTVLRHIATIKEKDMMRDPIEEHTFKCRLDSAKSKVLLAFAEYIELGNGVELIEELKEKILAAK